MSLLGFANCDNCIASFEPYKVNCTSCEYPLYDLNDKGECIKVCFTDGTDQNKCVKCLDEPKYYL